MIYLDHAATTPPIEPALRDAWPWLTSRFGNPSSQHAAGRYAARALAHARNRIADSLGTGPQCIVFTSGGTESVNLALRGLARSRPAGRLIVSAPIEHSCVLRTLEDLRDQDGFRIEWLKVDQDGRVDPDDLRVLVSDETTLVSLATANNETGVIQPMEAIRNICAEKQVPLHDDAIQSAGWIPVSLGDRSLNMVSLSGHKLGAPKGIGVLAFTQDLGPRPILTGGGQEHGIRSGTQNVGFAVAMATALDQALSERAAGRALLAENIAAFEDRIVSELTNVRLLVDADHHLESIRTVLIPGLEGGVLLQELDRLGICASSGSACASGSDTASHVLAAMGVDEDVIRSAVRFSFSTSTTAEELDRAADLVIQAVQSIESLRRN